MQPQFQTRPERWELSSTTIHAGTRTSFKRALVFGSRIRHGRNEYAMLICSVDREGRLADIASVFLVDCPDFFAELSAASYRAHGAMQ